MNRIQQLHIDLLATRNIIFLGVVVFMIALINFIIQHTFLNEQLLFNTYGDRIGYDRLKTIFSRWQSQQWLYLAFIPVSFLLKVGFTTLCVTIGAFYFTDTTSFSSNWNICLKVQYIYLLMIVVTFGDLMLLKEVNTVNDLSFIPFSFTQLLRSDHLPGWAKYPLQTVNVWELLYCLAGSYLFKLHYQVSYKRALTLFSVSYLIGLFLWVIVVVFLTVQFS
jgi:hypothetical protein